MHRSIALKPDHFESYRAVDYLLAREQRWSEIVAMWTDFLILYPDHADALFERSGTYYHQGDLVHCKVDLARACELGNQNACAQQRKMGG